MAMTLYDFHVSGHSHRIRLFLSLLGLAYDKVPVDMMEGEHKSPEYRKLNPLGQVPTFVDNDLVISDSCAALVYLALKYGGESWYPTDPAGAARVQRWLSTAAGELYRGPVIARAARRFRRDIDEEAVGRESKRLFRWMQQVLEQADWLAADHVTIADIAMYSYVRVADEGGLDTAAYPAIEAWLGRVEALEGFEAMPRS